ncbi:replicative DNA helicase [Candidatus Peregrinibacteria bacterium CG_4_9_14_0_2_um_filter_53_11]|nr:MAG: replicative DNA helicase [Candidatus Peregrinibacteria bacterium CG_4_9_14_0_2_um_filter_53_11]
MSTPPLSKIPPHSEEAEKATLGSLLIDKNAIIKVADFLEHEDFYFDQHGMIYEAMLDLFAKHLPIDLKILVSYLEDHGRLDTVGGASYIAELTADVPTATHVIQYGLIVKQKSTLRRVIGAGDAIMGLGYDETAEIESVLEEAEKTLFSVSQTFVKDRFVHIKEVLANTYEKISDLHDPNEKNKYLGIPTGFQSLDGVLSGFNPGDLVIIAARPSMGKTAFAMNIAQNIARRGLSVGVLSLEMSKEQLVERMFCALLGVDSWKLRTGKLSDEDFARIGSVMDDLNQTKIFIDDSPVNGIIELRTKARRLKAEHGLDILLIDYLQMMSISSKGGSFYSQNRVQEISEITRALKNLGRELHIPVIALSQLSRAVESRPNKVPVLSDLRESGSIEQDADVVMMIYREDYYEEDSDRKGVTDIFIRKHRNGPTGHIELMFERSKMRFFDIDRQRSGGVPAVYAED